MNKMFFSLVSTFFLGSVAFAGQFLYVHPSRVTTEIVTLPHRNNCQDHFGVAVLVDGTRIATDLPGNTWCYGSNAGDSNALNIQYLEVVKQASEAKPKKLVRVLVNPVTMPFYQPARLKVTDKNAE